MFLLIIVVLTILRPVSPYLLDGLAHTFWSEQHHEMMHLEGISHVDAQMEKINTDAAHSDKPSMSTENIENVFISLQQGFKLQVYPPLYNLSLFQLYNLQTQNSVIPEAIPPDVTHCVTLPEMLQITLG